MTRTLKQRLTVPIIGVLVLIIIVVSGFLYINRLLHSPIEIENIKVDASSALKLNVLNQISKKNGIKEWELKAASATLLKEESRALLENVNIIFYTKEGKQVTLVSQKGELNTATHDMTFSGNVITKYQTFTMRTDKLHYTKKEHIIHTDLHVRLEKADSLIEADSMMTRLNENKTILTGNVRGTFSENFNLQ